MSNEFYGGHGPGETPGYEQLMRRNENAAMNPNVPDSIRKEVLEHVRLCRLSTEQPQFSRLDFDVRDSTINKIVAEMETDYQTMQPYLQVNDLGVGSQEKTR